jgi:hypothetical protein
MEEAVAFDAHVKTLKSLKTTSLESYYQGFILADLNKSGFLHLHRYLPAP